MPGGKLYCIVHNLLDTGFLGNKHYRLVDRDANYCRALRAFAQVHPPHDLRWRSIAASRRA